MTQEAKTNIAVLALGIFLIGMIAWAGLADARKYEDPSLYWCEIVRNETPPLSCDWDSDQIPKTALKYWHQGMSPQEATNKAIEEANN